jgi:hypothetical protein
VPVDDAAEDLHARRAVEDPALDRPARRPDRQMPRLAATHERDDLQQRGERENRQRRARQRSAELVAAPGEQEREDPSGPERARDRDEDAVTATEVA